MVPLSVVIITLNEEKNIGRCLDSVQDIADDIVVVDSFSSDKTEEICKQYKVNFIQRKWEGYSKTKNYAGGQAKHDWILSLDADEALSEELKIAISTVKLKSEKRLFKFNRLTNYCGKWIWHSGWYPDTKIRMFDRKKASWQGIIHEKLISTDEQEAQWLKGNCLHYTYYSVQEHIAQANKFSEIAAKELFMQGKRSNWILIVVKTVAKFIRNYFLKLGILDGYYGFVICRTTAYETFLKYYKLKKMG